MLFRTPCSGHHVIQDTLFRTPCYSGHHVIQDTLSRIPCYSGHLVQDTMLFRTPCSGHHVIQDTLFRTPCYSGHLVQDTMLFRTPCSGHHVIQDTLFRTPCYSGHLVQDTILFRTLCAHFEVDCCSFLVESFSFYTLQTNPDLKLTKNILNRKTKTTKCSEFTLVEGSQLPSREAIFIHTKTLQEDWLYHFFIAKQGFQ